MFSPLSKGYATWTGDLCDPYADKSPDKGKLPTIEQNDFQHRHGVTVGHMSRPSTGLSFKSSHTLASQYYREDSDGRLSVPKTYLTRRGALMLYSSTDDSLLNNEEGPETARLSRQKMVNKLNVAESCNKLGTMERLSLSILQFGDQEYDRENASVTDDNSKKKMFMKFLKKQLEHVDVDERVQPGSELSYYLQDLKYKAGTGYAFSDTNISRNRETMELRALLRGLQENTWPMMYPQESLLTDRSNSFVDQFTRPSSRVSNRTASPTSQAGRSILSSKKLCASLKSVNSYMGRPSSTIPDLTDAEDQESTPISTGHLQSTWSLPTTPTKAKDARRIGSAPAASKDSSGDRAPSPQRKSHKLGIPMSMTGSSITEEIEPEEMEDEDQRPRSSRSLSTTGTGFTGTMVSDEDEYKFEVEVDVKDRGLGGGTPANFFALLEEEAQNEGVTDDTRESVHTSITQGDGGDSVLQGEGSIISDGVDKQLSKDFQDELSLVEGSDGSDVEILYTAGETKKVAGSSKSDTLEIFSSCSLLPENEKTSELEPCVSHPQTSDSFPTTLTTSIVETESNMVLDETQHSSLSVDRIAEDAVENPDEFRIKVDIQNISGQTLEQERLKTQELPMVEEEESNIGLTSEVGHKDSSETGQTDVLEVGHKDNLEGHKDVQESKEEIISGQKQISRHSTPVPASPKLSRVSTPRSARSRGSARSRSPKSPKTSRSVSRHSPDKERSTSRQSSGKDRTSSRQSNDRTSSRQSQGLADNVDTQPPAIMSVEITKVTSDNAGDIVDGGADDRVSVASSLLEEQDIVLPQEEDQNDAVKNDQQGHEEKEDVPPLQPQIKDAGDQKEKDALAEAQITDAKVTVDKSADEAVTKDTKQAGEFDQDILDLVKKNKTVQKKQGVPKKGQLPRSKKGPKKDPTQAIGITSVQGEDTGDKPKPEEPAKEDVPQKKVKIPVEKPKTVIPDYVAEAAQRRPGAAKEELDKEMKKMEEMMKDTLGEPITDYHESEGMSSEELALAQKAVQNNDDGQERLEKAKGVTGEEETPKAKVLDKKAAAGGKKGKKKVQQKDEMAEEKERLKQQRKLEKQQRLEEAKALQEKIAHTREIRKQKEKEAKDKATEIQLEIERLKKEADDMEQAEEDAKAVMAEIRRKQREERDATRKADLDKKKQQIRERREQEKRMAEEAKKKEAEMLSRIPDEEMRRRQREEEDRKRDEEDRLAEERLLEELQEAERLAEEEEWKIRELQREAEEEAMARIREEQEEAARKLREMAEQKRILEEEEERKNQMILEEEKRLEEERLRKWEEEERKREIEKQRIIELQRMEEEAREQLRRELVARREAAMSRRDVNVERRTHMNKLKHTQGITPPWTWSYFIKWPRESYDIPIGGYPQQKGVPGGKRKKKK